MIELKPCPFCGASGAKVAVVSAGGGHGESYDRVFVRCAMPGCRAEIGLSDYAGRGIDERKRSVAMRWNSRAVEGGDS